MSPDYISMIGTILGVFMANVAIVIALFIWVRTETRSDIRHIDSKLTVLIMKHIMPSDLSDTK